MIKELPAMERPREKILEQGVRSLSNAELIAVLIGSGTREQSAVAVAEKLLAMDPSGILYLGECGAEELCRIGGIGTAKAARLLAAAEFGRRLTTTPREKRMDASTPDRVAALFMEPMRCFHQEHFRILMLNVKNEIIAWEEISVGSIASSEAHPRDVFSPAIRRGAANIILIHNHPSGNPQPSQSDLRLTERLASAGELLGIRVLDHIIIGDGIYVSLRREGYFEA
ncbi:MAG: DNA repair protein RadC [Firmicutes bacterium]|nr:DNA repair protein RadC [Bacillota bacterium]